MELRLGLMASGNGSNVEAILKNIENKSLGATARIVISNNPCSGVLKIARDRSIPNACLNSSSESELENAVIRTMRRYNVNLIVLAGYMKKIGEDMIKIYNNRILNIHPALLPKHGGKGMYGIKVHRAVLESCDEETGATVHLVNSEYDKGRILAQRRILTDKSDTPETLAERVLKSEHILYSQVLRGIQKNIINLDE